MNGDIILAAHCQCQRASKVSPFIMLLCSRLHTADTLSDDARLTSVSVVYIGPKSRTERPMKTKKSTETHETRTPLSRSKGRRSTCRGRGHIVAASRTACYFFCFRCVVYVHHPLPQVRKGNNVRHLYELPDLWPLNSPDHNTIMTTKS